MNLLEQMMDYGVMMHRVCEPDGEGGTQTTAWREGAHFRMLAICDRSYETVIAGKKGLTSHYHVITGNGVKPAYHDVFKRVSDGKIFRVITDGNEETIPKSASMVLSKVIAEEWRLT